MVIDWQYVIDAILLFIGGFGFGYGLASRSERKRVNTIIGYFDRIDQAEKRIKERESEKY